MNVLRMGEGPPNARILLAGEYWGNDEAANGRPFAGASGWLLTKMLEEVGILRSECYLTNLINDLPRALPADTKKWFRKLKNRPKDIPGAVLFRGEWWTYPALVEAHTRLMREIEMVNPNVVVTLGGFSLLTLTGAAGVLKWRGSQLCLRNLDGTPTPRKLIPTLNPAAVSRDLGQKPAVLIDLRRAAAERSSAAGYLNVPQWKFVVAPTFDEAQDVLLSLIRRCEHDLEPPWIEFDLETRAGHIACAGISWSKTHALSVPFMTTKGHYWAEEEEAWFVLLLRRLLTHPRVRVRGQNLLYDCQYTHRWWFFVPRVAQDTMISHHTCHAGLPKSLAYQASVYCDHYVYWKDDGKTWDKNVGERQLWTYNCEDCVRTREVGEANLQNVRHLGLEAVDAAQHRLFWPVLWAMQRGVRIDGAGRQAMGTLLEAEMAAREEYFRSLLGHTLNPSSNPQMAKLFYEDFAQKPIYSAKPKPGQMPGRTCDSDALQTIAKREPLLRPLCTAIEEWRSLGVFLRTFVRAPLDSDGRMRCSYNICGAETFRFSSSENAFGSGTNLQNIPSGDEAPPGNEDALQLHLPNIKKLFIPDPGFTFFDGDLSKADLRIVQRESDEPELGAMLDEGRDPYVETAREFYHDPTITKELPDGSPHPKYRTFKSFAHGTHYLGTPVGLARRLGLTVHECDRTQAWYFGRYPRIKSWQTRFRAELAHRRFVQNIWGYRRKYHDRIDASIEREAIAWLPQSTVAILINRIWQALWDHFRVVQVLLQTHDSLSGQFPTHLTRECLTRMLELAAIPLPYPKPLIIPFGIKISTQSWGDCNTKETKLWLSETSQTGSTPTSATPV